MSLSTTINGSVVTGGFRSFSNAAYFHNPYLAKVISARGGEVRLVQPEPVVEGDVLLSAIDNSTLLSALTGEALISNTGM